MNFMTDFLQNADRHEIQSFRIPSLIVMKIIEYH